MAQGTIETWSIDKDGKSVLTGITRYNSEEISPKNIWEPSSEAVNSSSFTYSGVETRMMSDVPIA